MDHSASLRDTRAGTQGRNLHNHCLTACSLWIAQLAFFSHNPEPASQGWHCLQGPEPFQAYVQANMMEVFSLLMFPLPRMLLSCVKSTKPTQHTCPLLWVVLQWTGMWDVAVWLLCVCTQEYYCRLLRDKASPCFSFPSFVFGLAFLPAEHEPSTGPSYYFVLWGVILSILTLVIIWGEGDGQSTCDLKHFVLHVVNHTYSGTFYFHNCIFGVVATPCLPVNILSSSYIKSV